MKVVVAIDSLKGSLSSLEADHSSLEGLDDTGTFAAFFVRYYLGYFM